MKRISFLVLALAFTACATQPSKVTTTKEFSADRAIASDDCNPKPCVFIQDYNGSQAIFVGKGFSGRQSSYQVNIYANGTFIEDINTQNGSFSYTTPAGKATYGTRMEVKVLNWEGSGRHWVGNATIARKQTQQPSPDRMDDAKLVEYAQQQARTVANRVANTYGELEKWKYNFTMGYWQGVAAYSGMYEARVDQDNGLAAGRERGEAPGFQAGRNHGASIGSKQGSTTARDRFRAIVNTANAPDLNMGSINVPAFAGLSAPTNACDSASSRQNELERQLASEMRIIRFGDDDLGYLVYDATYYSITFSELYRWGNGKYEFLDSWFRSDYAWDEWFQNDLGGKYNKTAYRKLDGNQAAEFKREFAREYDRRIDEKFYKKKTEYNAAANARGQWYGVQISKKKKFDEGCNQGYAERYAPASVRGFNSSYVSGFQSGFSSTANQYNSNPILAIDGIRLLDGNLNGVYELGETLGVEIGSVTNLGRVAARNLPVTMTGEGLITRGSTESFTVEPSTSKAVNRQVMNLAQIREDVIADKDHSVSVSVGSQTQALSYNVSWAGAIQALKTIDASRAASLKNFVLKNIQNEYITNEQAKNNIYTEGGRSKMQELVDLSKANPGNDVISSMGPALIAWQSTYKHAHNKWGTGKLRKSFTALANQIK